MNGYRTIKKQGFAETIVEKSRFIAYIKPINTMEEGKEFVDEIKKIHREATHNVPVICVGDKGQNTWTSDDGEPQGTSGPPILQMLNQEKISNLVIVVTRYFGGTKLGTGGLVRAYTGAAKKALAEGQILPMIKKIRFKVTYPYDLKGRLQGVILKVNGEETNLVYAEKIQSYIVIEPEMEKTFKHLCSNIFGENFTILAKEEFLTT